MISKLLRKRIVDFVAEAELIGELARDERIRVEVRAGALSDKAHRRSGDQLSDAGADLHGLIDDVQQAADRATFFLGRW